MKGRNGILRTTHEPARAILHKDALLSVTRRGAHLEMKVGQTSRLRNLPVDASARTNGLVRQIDDEVSNLTVKRMKR